MKAASSAQIRTFPGRDAGNVAMIVALALVPLAGSVGLALDFRRLSTIRSEIQETADAAALNTASVGPKADQSKALQHASETISSVTGQAEPNVTGQWIGESDYVVNITTTVPTVMVQLVPGARDRATINVVSVARRVDPVETWKEPARMALDPEASDYNRLIAYCYRPTQEEMKERARELDDKAEGKQHEKPKRDDNQKKDLESRRTDHAVMADNAGTSYPDFRMPQCSSGSYLSFKLHNVRNGKNNRARWENGGGDPELVHSYNTDTIPGEVVEAYRKNAGKNPGKKDHGDSYGLEKPILETVICNTDAECKAKDKGGIIPSGKNRDPVQAEVSCSKGKYIYLGWEDRPPPPRELTPAEKQCDWARKDCLRTDKDYDDIRVVLECPTKIMTGTLNVRLIR